MKKFLLPVFTLFIGMLPLTGWSHPGHGESDGFTLIHYFREPLHAVGPLAILVTLLLYRIRWSRNKARQERA
jgi:hypothetical protein